MKKITRPLNAVKTGVYASEHLLPWEDRAVYERFRPAIWRDLAPVGKIQECIVQDIVDNRWRRRRVRSMSAIATHRHPLGRAMEPANSWREGLAVVHRRRLDEKNTFDDIAAKIGTIAQAAEDWSAKSGQPVGVEEVVRKFDVLQEIADRLVDIGKAQDEVRNFFLEYSPKHLERQIRIENSLDAQYDKLRTRLLIEQEARADAKSRERRHAADKSPGARDDVGKAILQARTNDAPSDDRRVGIDVDLDRDDDDTDDWGEPRKLSAEVPEPSAGGRSDNDDPLQEFVSENRS